eukprot:851681-Prymnesium_polylepis.1
MGVTDCMTKIISKRVVINTLPVLGRGLTNACVDPGYVYITTDGKGLIKSSRARAELRVGLGP